jgi:transposase-like protein
MGRHIRLTVPPEAVARYERGAATLSDLARGLGSNHATVARALRRQGVRVGRGIAQRAARVREAARLRAEGLTYAQVGERLGVTKQRAAQLVRAAGVADE